MPAVAHSIAASSTVVAATSELFLPAPHAHDFPRRLALASALPSTATLGYKYVAAGDALAPNEQVYKNGDESTVGELICTIDRESRDGLIPSPSC